VFLQRVGHPDIEYRLDMPDRPVVLECDGRLVGQALTNILKNAAEAIRGGEDEEDEDEKRTRRSSDTKIGRIHIGLSTDDTHVIVSVTDSGCGLPDTDRTRLTEPYITTRTKGTGLGLAIVNKVMEDHGGELVLDDAPASDGWESGARVRLIFPLRRIENQAASIGQAIYVPSDEGSETKEAVDGV
jgi:two-component system nitrogen regulation sensor histidine kinase NtrY